MIDVVFLLLVFFVCASIGQTPDRLLAAALAAGTVEQKSDPVQPPADMWDHQQVRIRLTLENGAGQNAAILVNEQRVTGLDDLRSRLARLAEADAESPIILDIDDNVQVQQFITIYDLCQSLKFQSISFATRSGGKQSP